MGCTADSYTGANIIFNENGCFAAGGEMRRQPV